MLQTFGARPAFAELRVSERRVSSNYVPDDSRDARIASETQRNFVFILVKGKIMGISKFLIVVIFLTASFIANTRVFAFSQVIVFGDSLSDDGNIAHRVRDAFGFSYPSSNFNYSDYRFTDDTNTAPAANLYTGTWHEQLAKTFLSCQRQRTASMAELIMPSAVPRPRMAPRTALLLTTHSVYRWRFHNHDR